jgi:hypothetical protein
MFSSQNDEVTVVSADETLALEHEDFLDQSHQAPAVIVVERMLFGKVYLTAYPCNKDGQPDTNRMFGGCFIYSCDSRFRSTFSEYPIPLHDRKE